MSDGIELKVARAYQKIETGLGRARMDQASREALGLSVGDIVEIVGKKSVAAKIFKDVPPETGLGIVCIDGMMRSNAGVSVDDMVIVYKRDMVPANKVVLAPNISPGKRISFKGDVNESFRNGLNGRPVIKGNDVMIPNISLMGNTAMFTVVSTVPTGVVVIGPYTELVVNDEPEKSQTERGFGITYDDVGGLDDELKRIRDLIELPLKHPELFDRLGINAPKGVLLYGPPGTGKTLIAKAVAKESGASFYSVQGPEIVSKYYGQSEESLRELFKRAEENAPSIIFLDEIDSIAPDRDSVTGEVERRVVAQLLTLMDGMSGRGDVIVIGATNRDSSIDPALRRPGRFDREIEIGIPGRDGRIDILNVHMRGMPLDSDVDVQRLGGMTQGFVGADLAALAREAAMKCLSRNMHLFEKDAPISEDVLQKVRVTMRDFTDALAEVEASGMREVLVDIPKVKWTDIGGLDSVREEIMEAFVPEEDAKGFHRLGIDMPKGVLLYGPPGTGKTMIAKAVANESGANFIAINGPEMGSKWMGESEKALRKIFKRAKQMAPCIIFFDEIDAIAPKRGRENNGSWERVVNQLLTLMDGMEDMPNVTVIGATNRPDMIDSALLRPGRFDMKIYIGPPELEDRIRILEIHTAKMPLMGVDFDILAEKTEGFVGADIAELCRIAGMTAYRENRDAQYISMEHFEKALEEVQPSVNSDELKEYQSMKKNLNRRRQRHDDIPFYG